MNTKSLFRFVSITVVSISLILLYCGSPSKPEFKYAPKITGNMVNSVGAQTEDSLFILYILLDEGDEPITYKWDKNGSPVNGAGNDSLLFSSLSLADNGVYWCIAANEHGRDTSQPHYR